VAAIDGRCLDKILVGLIFSRDRSEMRESTARSMGGLLKTDVISEGEVWLNRH
jgi:hypothetical protein